MCSWRAATSSSSQRWRGVARNTGALLWADMGSSEGQTGRARSYPLCERAAATRGALLRKG